CSTKEVPVREEVLEAQQHADSAWPALRAYRHADTAAFDGYSSQKADALFSLFVKNGTWVVPTLTNTRASIYSDDTNFNDAPRLRSMPENLLNFWRPDENSHLLTEKERRSKELALERYLRLVRAMHRRGVQILPGTDTP